METGLNLGLLSSLLFDFSCYYVSTFNITREEISTPYFQLFSERY